jgi:hypothetical protein
VVLPRSEGKSSPISRRRATGQGGEATAQDIIGREHRNVGASQFGAEGSAVGASGSTIWALDALVGIFVLQFGPVPRAVLARSPLRAVGKVCVSGHIHCLVRVARHPFEALEFVLVR